MQKLTIAIILLCMTSVVVDASEWTGSWGCSIYSDSQLDANIGNATLRQVVRVSIPGNQIRLKFSNLYGTTPLVMQKVHLAQSAGGHSINTSTDIAVTFSGSESVTIPAGGAVTSDALTYNLPALTNMAITIYFGSVPSTKSGHVGSRTTSYYQSGDAVSASSLTSPASSARWYVIAAIDVYREDAARAVVAYGDSITDGYGTTTDAQNRWTDFFATRLQGETQTSDVGMLNQGIGATTVSGSGLNRLQRDVLDQADVKYLIVVYGVNDIGGSTSVSNILSAYQSIITNAHNDGILVYGGTITPFGGNGYYSSTNETERQQVNTWIRSTSAAAGGFDAVIDFDVALRDPSDNTRLLPVYSNDGLHPSIAGYQAMANAINLGLFSLDTTPPAEPTGLTATTQSYKRIDLNWNDNGESDLSHYHVWRSTTAGGPYSQIATDVTVSSYSDPALSASTPYYYVVTAVDISSNESANSAESQAATHDLPNDTDPPTPNPATWASVPSAVGGSVINMAAATGSDAYGPVQYSFEETSGNPGATSSGWQTGSSYTDTGLSAGTQYTYRVRMRDDLGNIGSYSISRSVTTLETLKVDFNGNNWGAVIVETQAGFEAYNARNEVVADFIPVQYNAFNTTVTVTPTWATGAVAAVMQSMWRANSASPNNYVEDEANMFYLIRDWIGTDTRSAGDPMTLTISGLPAGTYTWLSYHHDIAAATMGKFDVTVNDASGSTKTTGIQITGNAVKTIDGVAKFTTTIVSNGINAVSLVFDQQPYANEYNQAWFVMNGFELAIIGITNCQQVQSSGFRLEADLNGDCEIETADLVLLATQWLSTSPAAVAPNYSPDLVADNKINLADFAAMAGQWLICNDPEIVGCIENW